MGDLDSPANLSRERREKIFSNNLRNKIWESEKVQKAHYSNELHKYGGVMQYLIHIRKHTAKEARDLIVSIKYETGFLPSIY